MTALDLRGIVDHGRAELAVANEMAALHQHDRYGLCLCMRVWPCNVHVLAVAWVRYWEARLAVHEPQLAALTAPTAQFATVAR